MSRIKTLNYFYNYYNNHVYKVDYLKFEVES